MSIQKSAFRNQHFGFTLIELLVVLAIIGILAGLVLASLSSSRARARDAQRKSDLRQIRTALSLRQVDIGSYPNYDTGEFIRNMATSFIEAPPSTKKYLQNLPTDQKYKDTTQDYCYRSYQNAHAYILWAQLEVPSDPDRYQPLKNEPRGVIGTLDCKGITGGTRYFLESE